MGEGWGATERKTGKYFWKYSIYGKTSRHAETLVQRNLLKAKD